MSNFIVDTGGTLFTNLISYYKLEEATGTRVDSVGTNNLTDNNAVTNGTGIRGNAAQFARASNQNLTHVDNAALSTGDIDFTFAGWVFLDSKPSQMGIAGKGDGGGATSDEWRVEYLGGVTDRFLFIVRGGTAAVIANNFGSPATGTWYFIVVWHDSVGNTINISVNNGTADSTAFSGGPNDTTSGFVIGNGFNPIISAYSWDGKVDEAGFWKKLLSSQEKIDLYNGGTGNTITNVTTSTKTINANTNIKTTLTKTIDANTNLITAQNTDTINANTDIFGALHTETITANTVIKVIATKTIDAVTFIKKTILQPIGAVTTILLRPTKTISANTTILAREPNLVLYKESDLSTPVGTLSNPLNFGTVDAGTTVLQVNNPFVLFNDKGGTLKSFDAREVTISVVEFNLVDELLGSSNGLASQLFTVAFPPAVDNNDKITIKVNNIGWTRVSSFAGFQPTSEIYTFNATTGTITFGDGLQGKIPPAGNSIKASYTPDTQLFGKQAIEQLWIGVQSSGVISNNITTQLEERNATDTTHVQIIHHPKVVSVSGVWLATDPNRLGTNYFTGGGFNDQTGIINLGTPLPSIQRVLVDYVYTIADDAEGIFTQLNDVVTHTFTNSIPSNNAKRLNFLAAIPSDASSSGLATIKLKVRITYKI